MDIQLDRIRTASGFNMSRFALEFVIVSDTDRVNANKSLTPQNTTTLDDEHTPGIFKVLQLLNLLKFSIKSVFMCNLRLRNSSYLGKTLHFNLTCNGDLSFTQHQQETCQTPPG